MCIDVHTEYEEMGVGERGAAPVVDTAGVLSFTVSGTGQHCQRAATTI